MRPSRATVLGRTSQQSNPTDTQDPPTTPNTTATKVNNVVQEVNKHKQNLYKVNELNAKELLTTQTTLDEHKQKIETLKQMIQRLTADKEKGAQPTQYSIDTPPRHKILIEGAAKLFAAVTINNDYDDRRTVQSQYIKCSTEQEEWTSRTSMKTRRP